MNFKAVLHTDSAEFRAEITDFSRRLRMRHSERVGVVSLEAKPQEEHPSFLVRDRRVLVQQAGGGHYLEGLVRTFTREHHHLAFIASVDPSVLVVDQAEIEALEILDEHEFCRGNARGKGHGKKHGAGDNRRQQTFFHDED